MVPLRCPLAFVETESVNKRTGAPSRFRLTGWWRCCHTRHIDAHRRTQSAGRRPVRPAYGTSAGFCRPSSRKEQHPHRLTSPPYSRAAPAFPASLTPAAPSASSNAPSAPPSPTRYRPARTFDGVRRTFGGLPRTSGPIAPTFTGMRRKDLLGQYSQHSQLYRYRFWKAH